jgi:hypothetical protein
MFDHTIFKPRVPLLLTIAWYWGGLLETFIHPLPSLAKVGPIGGGVCRVKAKNNWPMGISLSVSATPLH